VNAPPTAHPRFMPCRLVLHIPALDASVRRAVLYIDETLIPLLQNLLQDSNPEVTSAALRAVTIASRGNVREISSRKRPVIGPNNEEDDSISVSERS
jgi:hypothetical protein